MFIDFQMGQELLRRERELSSICPICFSDLKVSGTFAEKAVCVKYGHKLEWKK